MSLQHAFIWNKQCDNVNQILLTILFAVTYFHDQDKDYLDNNLPEKLDDLLGHGKKYLHWWYFSELCDL